MRHAPKIAAFACASLALGSAIALITPTELRTAPNSGLERLSQPHPVSYPGQDRVIAGPDSYPVTYSPQYLAIARQAERAKLQRWELPPLEQVGYDQPSAARDAAIELEGAGDVTVHRGSSDSTDEPAQLDQAGDPGGADPTEG